MNTELHIPERLHHQVSIKEQEIRAVLDSFADSHDDVVELTAEFLARFEGCSRDWGWGGISPDVRTEAIAAFVAEVSCLSQEITVKPEVIRWIFADSTLFRPLYMTGNDILSLYDMAERTIAERYPYRNSAAYDTLDDIVLYLAFSSEDACGTRKKAEIFFLCSPKSLKNIPHGQAHTVPDNLFTNS